MDSEAPEPCSVRSNGRLVSALEDFDSTLAAHSRTDGDAWSDDGVVLLGRLAADLPDQDLHALGRIWPKRPPMWQRHLAEVLDQACPRGAIDLLLGRLTAPRPKRR